MHRRVCGFVFTAATLLAFEPAIFQLMGQARAPGDPALGGGEPPGTPARTGNREMMSQASPSSDPVFISGRVMTDNGLPVGQNTLVVSVCNGATRAEAYTDSHGRFTFELGGRNDGVSQDASMASPGSGRADGAWPGDRSGAFGLRSCQLEARLAGYNSDAIQLTKTDPLGNPDVGVIILHRLQTTSDNVVSVTTLGAPKDAQKAYEKGLEAFRKNELGEARKQFEKATERYPAYARAWHDLGMLQIRESKLDEARQSFEASIKADPTFVESYLGMAVVLAEQQRWLQLVATSDQAIKLDPYDYPQAFYLNAVGNYNTGKVDAAEKSAREAVRMDNKQRFPRSLHLLGVILAARRQFGEAASQLRAYLECAPRADDAAQTRAQLQEYERLAMAEGPTPAQTR